MPDAYHPTPGLSVYFHSSEHMTELADESVRLIVTSPPYFDYKIYGGIGVGAPGFCVSGPALWIDHGGL